MLRKLLRGLREAAPETSGVNRELATAVLLLEVARADYQDQPGELDAVRAALATEFGLDAVALNELLAGAQRESHAAVSLHDYVETLNRTLSVGEKVQLLKRLWDVAYADGKIEALEEHTLRKLAELLYVPQADFIRGKLAAKPPT